MKIVFSKVIVLVKNLFWFLIRTSNIARKTKFYFSRRPEKMVFPKKSWWNMISLVLSGKMIFLFSENMILPLDGKWKMIFVKKNTRKYDIFFKCSEKMVFSKEIITLGYDLYCIIWKDGIFSRKHDISSLGRKRGMTFLKKYMEIWYFLCTRTGVTNVVSRPTGKKYPRSSYRAKIHLKMIGVLDWYPRAPAILRTFMETFTGISCIALQRKKNRKLNI